jgi:hypothetical protein
MCSMLLRLRLEQPVTGSEEGSSQVMQNTENFFISCFICSQFGEGEQIAMTRSNVVSPWGIR